MKRAETFSRTIRCPVELRDVSGVRAGLVRVVQPEGVRVQLPLDEGESLCIGALVEVIADLPPIGPLRTTARVASLESEKDRHGHAVLSTALRFENLSDLQRQALTIRLRAVRPLVLTFGLDRSLGDVGTEECLLVEAAGEEEILRRVDEEDVAVLVLVLGPRLRPTDAHRILSRCRSQCASNSTANIVVGVGADASLFQDCIDEDRVFYLSRGPLTDGALYSLIVAAAAQFRARTDADGALSDPAATDELLDFCVRIASQTDVPGVGDLLVEAAQAMLHADRVEYLIYDAATSLLWSEKGLATGGRSESAASGLLGYVVRTGERIDMERPGLDPRLDVEADHLKATDDVRFLAEPIVGSMGHVVGLVTILRSGESEPFSAADAQVIERLAEYAGAAMSVILLKRQAQTALLKRRHSANDLEMYRQEALDENFESAEEPGNLLNLSPRWLTRAHWLAMSLFLTALLYAMFVNISEYATGPALIRARNKIPVIAAKAGLVRSVEVSVGDHVRIGDLLVRFSDAPGTTTADRVAEQLWAAGNGIIGDIRVRPGQQVNQGEVAATIVDQDAGYEVLGFIPGNYAPQLHPGMPLVLRVQGYQGSSEIMRIDRVGSEILGAQDALRHAGREGGATLPLSGPVVVISAQLHSPKFSQDSRTYRYHDGMSGDIDVSVRSDRLITTVLRGLKNAFAR